MSRFGWAYVNDVITGSGGTPGGSDKAIQFASGSTFSGSTNFTFDYTTNTVRLTGTLYADTLIVSSSTIYKSGSTKFGDDSGDTHQFTGSLLLSSSYISQADYLDFNVSASIPTYKHGRVFSDIDTGDLSYYLPYASQKLQIGQQTVVKSKNSTGSPISKGSLVRIIGGVGDNPLIATASWENDSNSANTLGMLMSTVAHNDFGYVLLNGVLTGINTDPATFTAGQVVYLSSSGTYTATAPVAPKHTVRIGEVVRAHATVGSIFVKIDNGYELDELHNVLITSPSSGDLLTYNSSSAIWTNTKSLTGSYTLTGSLSASNTITAASVIVNGNISGSGNINGSGLQVTGNGQFGSNLIVTGTLYVIGTANATSFVGSGAGLTGINAYSSVNAIGKDGSIQYKDTGGTITGSNSFTYSGNILSVANAVYTTTASFNRLEGNVTGNLAVDSIVGWNNVSSQFLSSNIYKIGSVGTQAVISASNGLAVTGNVDFSNKLTVLTASYTLLQGPVTGTLTLDSIVAWNSAKSQFQNSSIYTTVGASQAIISASSGLVVSGATNLGSVYERLLLTSSIPATVTFDTTAQSTLYINNPSANFVLNLTNVSTTDSRVSTYNIIISQSATPYSASSIQVNTTASTVKWVNSTVPTGNASKHDIYGLSLIRSGSTWVTLGQLSTYG